MRSPPQRLLVHWVEVVFAFAIFGEAQAAPYIAGASHFYAPCVVCHQPNAWGSRDGSIPSLAGQQLRYLEKQLTMFQSGARVDSAVQVVGAHTKFSDQQSIVALAAISAVSTQTHIRLLAPVNIFAWDRNCTHTFVLLVMESMAMESGKTEYHG